MENTTDLFMYCSLLFAVAAAATQLRQVPRLSSAKDTRVRGAHNSPFNG